MAVQGKTCGQLFKQINDELQRRANNQMRSQDITMSQATVLLELAHAPSSTLSMKELEKRLNVAQPTVVGLINRLEQKNLVDSFGEPNDKRTKLVKLTADGLLRVQQTEDCMDNVERNMLSGLTDTERDILYSLLKKVHNGLK